jgi:Zn-dependent M28 family amino/carboxypeptidase
MRYRIGLAAAALAVSVCMLVTLAPVASAQLQEVNTQRLRNAVTVNGILQHERAFQTIANLNGGTRASGTPGYRASLEYVKARLQRAGYTVSEQEFTFPFFRDLAAPELEQVSPTPQTYETATFQYSGSGEVTGRLVPVNDNQIPPGPTPSSSNAGCEAADFTPAPATEPAVALIQRGTCDFAVKAANAQAAGYDAVIIFNEGQEGRQELLTGTLGGPIDIPVVGLSFADGAALDSAARAGTVVMRVFTSTETELNARTWNLIAETERGDASQQVFVGAHLDSVVEGPGINDNGSGTSTILEIAEEMAELGVNPRRQLKFAFWGAEESGLLGSEHYVAQLGPLGIGDVYANLNFDMVGSPNYVRFVYDGDGSDTPVAGPPGSAQIEALFNNYFAGQGLATDPTAFDGRSDYGPFIAVGVPAGGLFSGAEGIKTAEQAAVYGGTAGIAYDPCYHQACDTINNLSTRALSEMSDGAAHAALTLARSRTGFFEDGSRVAAKKVARSKRFAGPQALR